jgi:hypothetical protein
MGVKCAVTLLTAFMLMEAGLAPPLKSPLQWSKLYPSAGLAVRFTVVPAS